MRSSIYITIRVIAYFITRNLAYISSLIFAFISMLRIFKKVPVITLKYGYVRVKISVITRTGELLRDSRETQYFSLNFLLF